MDSAQKAKGEKATAGKVVTGQGVESTVGSRGTEMWAGDNPDGFRVFVSCIKQTPKQNHTHFLTN